MTGIAVVLVVFIICTTILSGMYMYYYSENEVKMFSDPRYDERISELEKKVEELEK